MGTRYLLTRFIQKWARSYLYHLLSFGHRFIGLLRFLQYSHCRVISFSREGWWAHHCFCLLGNKIPFHHDDFCTNILLILDTSVKNCITIPKIDISLPKFLVVIFWWSSADSPFIEFTNCFDIAPRFFQSDVLKPGILGCPALRVCHFFVLLRRINSVGDQWK